MEGPLFLGTCLAIYSARQPITMLARGAKQDNAGRSRPVFWLAVYVALALAFGVPLLLSYGRWLLLPWAAVFAAFTAGHLVLKSRKLDRTIPGELITIAGLALTAPGAYYVARGFEPAALYLWGLTTLYSGSSAFYVRMKMRQRALKRPARNLRERLVLGKANVIYLAILALAVGTAATTKQIPWLAPLAFLPLGLKVLDGILRGGPQVNIKRVGWTEVIHSIAFTVLLIATYLISSGRS